MSEKSETVNSIESGSSNEIVNLITNDESDFLRQIVEFKYKKLLASKEAAIQREWKVVR